MTALTGAAPAAELARAKVNLALHITGQRTDGYHLLESLVVFPQIGDRLSIEASETLELSTEGPFAHDLEGASEDNLVLKAAALFAEEARTGPLKLKMTLSKRLPVASGIGGGSSDAATALRLLEDHTGICLDDDRLQEIALKLGADVPVCLSIQPQLMRGIGGEVSHAPQMPKCGMVLVNPRFGVSTPEVFRALQNRKNASLPPLPDNFETLSELTDLLRLCRNDLQMPAIETCPEIGEILETLGAEDGIDFARMSGSGATVFGLCEAGREMELERSLRMRHPDWWIASGRLA
ncbi:MAG: 4-(cytidine 5'-diphospho)-2-C-methyl-D-erythritol kinase [Roseibium sp.]|uniref:4-(cytidine 5'-diphospho)-2-C-methyl-D-erythritol kinase n=1 Tax=Roseibium sp. TaxID=1936156 RepID=UPI003D9C3177